MKREERRDEDGGGEDWMRRCSKGDEGMDEGGEVASGGELTTIADNAFITSSVKTFINSCLRSAK